MSGRVGTGKVGFHGSEGQSQTDSVPMISSRVLDNILSVSRVNFVCWLVEDSSRFCVVLDHTSGAKHDTTVVCIAGATSYQDDHLMDHVPVLEKAQVVHSGSFFVTVSSESLRSHRRAATSRSTPFIMQVPPFETILTKKIPNVEVLIENETEAATFAETDGWEENDAPSIEEEHWALVAII